MKINSKSRKINKAWLNDHVNDPYVKLAQKEGYRARAAYKLKEIDESLGLIKPGQLVIDLGCAPGAWSQYLRRRFAPKTAGSGGAASGELHACMGGRRADVVVSDMAPNLSGIESADAARMAHLVELAVEFAQAHLHRDGALVCKVFHGSGYSQLAKLFKDSFRVVKPIKPKASRDKSAETFLVGIGLKSS
jgi:23S rRNA (uridine2552-2'-O)-methyltransferase